MLVSYSSLSVEGEVSHFSSKLHFLGTSEALSRPEKSNSSQSGDSLERFADSKLNAPRS